MKVMEVMYREGREIYYDFFTKDEYKLVIDQFFIKGGYELPKSMKMKNIKRLTQKDYTELFELLGYDVLGFNKYDPDRHVEQYTMGSTAAGKA